MSFTIARRFLFLSTQRAVSHRSRRFGCKAYLVSWILSSFFSLLFFFSSMMFPKKEPRRRRRQKMAPKNSKFLFPQKGKSPQNCMSSLLLRKSTWTTTTTFFRQHSVVRFGTARRAMSSSSSGMMARPLVSSMMGHTPRGRASSSSSINAKTTLRRGERVRTFAFGARKAPKGQLPEREPSMGLDPENAQAKVTHTHTHTHTHTEHFVIEKHFDLFFFFLSFWEIFSSSVERERERERTSHDDSTRTSSFYALTHVYSSPSFDGFLLNTEKSSRTCSRGNRLHFR